MGAAIGTHGRPHLHSPPPYAGTCVGDRHLTKISFTSQKPSRPPPSAVTLCFVNPPGPAPVSRRTTLKAGAHVAWTVPVIAVASAAPAFASSGTVSLVLDYFTAAYDGDRGDQLVTSFALRNAGTGPATDLTFTFFIPPGLYDVAPNVINAPSTWIALSTLGSPAAGWQVRWFRSGQLGAGLTTGNEAAPFRIQFLDPLIDPPYRRWAAKAFTANLLVQPSNSTSVIGGHDVPAGPLATFPIPEYYGSYSADSVTLQGVVQNDGRSSSDDVVLRFWWEPLPGHPAWGAAPIAVSSPQLGTGVVTGSGTGPTDPWFVTFADAHGPTATLASYGPNPPDEELETTYVPFTVNLTLAAAPTERRDFYMTAHSADSTDPVPGTGPGWSTTTVAEEIIFGRP